MPAQPLSRHSVSVYLAGEDQSDLRREFIDGQMYAMPGAVPSIA